MKLAILTPFYLPSVRGNAVTVHRIASGLEDQGLKVRVFSLEAYVGGLQGFREALHKFRPDILHGFHAFTSGPVVAQAALELRRPVVISATGTDINLDLFDQNRREAVLAALRRADRIVVFHQFMQAKVAAEIPEVQGKIRVISQSVHCLEQPYDLRGKLGLSARDFVFLVPAGIRRVKNVTFCLRPLAELHRLHPGVKVVFAGPILEEEEGRRLLRMIEGLPWAFYLGTVPHEQFFAMLKSVDVVLNTSLSEGGMANAILEAMSRGVAVLASDIEGNRSVVEDGVNGLLFDSAEAFRRKAEALVVDEGLRTRLGQAARAKVEREFTWEREIQGYLALYRDLKP